jgi:hypothetical protein
MMTIHPTVLASVVVEAISLRSQDFPSLKQEGDRANLANKDDDTASQISCSTHASYCTILTIQSRVTSARELNT